MYSVRRMKKIVRKISSCITSITLPKTYVFKTETHPQLIHEIWMGQRTTSDNHFGITHARCGRLSRLERGWYRHIVFIVANKRKATREIKKLQILFDIKNIHLIYSIYLLTYSLVTYNQKNLYSWKLITLLTLFKFIQYSKTKFLEIFRLKSYNENNIILIKMIIKKIKIQTFLLQESRSKCCCYYHSTYVHVVPTISPGAGRSSVLFLQSHNSFNIINTIISRQTM